MQSYTITVINHENPSDTSSQVADQAAINALLDSYAPYNEQEMFDDINDETQAIVALVEVETEGEYFKWHGACYSKEVFNAMIATALKRNLVETLTKG